MQLLSLALLFGLSAAQSLNIPTNKGTISGLPSSCKTKTVGNKLVLAAACTIPAGQTVDFGNREVDRGMKCTDGDTGSKNAVFVLENGATIQNVIIGSDALEGIHCKGKCTVKNAFFRKVCEDAISALGNGDVMIVGGGAQDAEDKVVQHNGSGKVTIKDYTVVNVGKVYRACGDCSNNSSKGPRHVVIENLKANGVKTNLAGINSNYGDSATISKSCGKVSSEICQQFKGINKGELGKGVDSPKVSGKDKCLGVQGKLAKGALPKC